MCVCASEDARCVGCARWYGCHISASSTFHPAVCGEKQFVSRSPTPSALHRSLLFHHRKAMLRWPQRTPVWVDRKYLSVHARVSYSRPILILNQLENENGAGIMCPNQQAVKECISVIIPLFFLWGEKYLISAKWLNFKCFVSCFEGDENPKCVTHAWADWEKYTSGWRGWYLELWVLFCSMISNIIFYFIFVSFWSQQLNNVYGCEETLDMPNRESEQMDTGYIRTQTQI